MFVFPTGSLFHTSHPSDVVTLTEEATGVLTKVSQLVYSTSLQWYDTNAPLMVLVLWIENRVLGALWQSGPLMWIH